MGNRASANTAVLEFVCIWYTPAKLSRAYVLNILKVRDWNLWVLKLSNAYTCNVLFIFLMGTSWSSNVEFRKYYDQQATEQIALQNVLFEHKRALELASTRKLISNEFMVALLAVSLMLVSQKMKQPHLFTLPAVPVVIGLFYNFDQQRDITLDTIKEKALELRRENRRLFEPIGGPITLDELDRRILAKYHKEEESNEAN
ncbi:unnamed protein product [Litomosoides sigmodontis]|uniref:Uncharacterized protein n=1 Tax=Litomosoides sigmodontis TaxID=42156 RepID=A0A3P6T4B9_LITSI|nr:unnamed protein product [Litomosoides sigmodontis]